MCFSPFALVAQCERYRPMLASEAERPECQTLAPTRIIQRKKPEAASGSGNPSSQLTADRQLLDAFAGGREDGAQCCAATEFGARQAQFVVQAPQERHRRIAIVCPFQSVDA
jgi:hypothetical protein